MAGHVLKDRDQFPAGGRMKRWSLRSALSPGLKALAFFLKKGSFKLLILF
jgi:hypothetical protein